MRLSLMATAALATAGLALAAVSPATAQPAASGVYTVHPIAVQSPFKAATRPAALPTPSQCVQIYGLACNTPATIRSAYNIPATVGGAPAGTGKTIAIIDAYGDPTVQADLDAFSATMNIPSTTLHVTHVGGNVDWSKPTDAMLGWAGEISLDVQWAHAVAPGATIELVVADSPKDEHLNNALRYAVDNLNPDVVSMSYGLSELYQNNADANNLQEKQAASTFAAGVKKGITFFASSGDDYSDNNLGSSNFSFPASDPNVVAVGGTSLFSTLTNYTGPRETVWDGYDGCPFGCAYGPDGGTGGAPSLWTGKPGSDVAFNASSYTAVLVYAGFYPNPDDNGFYFYGGTSEGSPAWAAIGAILDQDHGSNLGNIRGSLKSWASAGAFNDVTDGDNKAPTFQGGYSAGPGWDVPTGYGSPDVGKLLGLIG